MPFIAILTDGDDVKFVKSTNPARKPLLTRDFSKAKRFTESDMLALDSWVGGFIAQRGALLEFHEVSK